MAGALVLGGALLGVTLKVVLHASHLELVPRAQVAQGHDHLGRVGGAAHAEEQQQLGLARTAAAALGGRLLLRRQRLDDEALGPALAAAVKDVHLVLGLEPLGPVGRWRRRARAHLREAELLLDLVPRPGRDVSDDEPAG